MEFWPKNVGILAIDCIFPSHFVDITELEEYDEALKGKYVNRLGQLQIGVCTDREDINSVCLTAVQRLLERYRVKPPEIGRLEVGTDATLDTLKSVRNTLMQLFEPYGVIDLEGTEVQGSCYSGTGALFNSIAWIESSAWNGRYAIVVVADVVVGERSATAAGGAGAVAMLVGPDAPLVIDRGLRGTVTKYSGEVRNSDMTAVYNSTDDYITATNQYLEALQQTYQSYREKVQKKVLTMDNFDYLLFHAPFYKIAQNAVARLTVIDFVNCISKSNNCDSLLNCKSSELSEIESVEKALCEFSKETFNEKTLSSLLITRRIGNTNAASLYGALVSLLINHNVEQLAGKKIFLFSYASNASGTMYSITIAKDTNNNSKLCTILSKLVDVKEKLETRKKMSPKEFEEMLHYQEKNKNEKPYSFKFGTKDLFSGSYYLTQINGTQQREYKRKTDSN